MEALHRVMELNKDNVEVFAAKYYLNESCLTVDEFREDLKVHRSAKKFARRFAQEKTDNIRLFCNQVLMFTNNFETNAAKQMLLFGLEDKERAVMLTVLNYLGFTQKYEVKIDIYTAMALKDMDR